MVGASDRSMIMAPDCSSDSDISTGEDHGEVHKEGVNSYLASVLTTCQGQMDKVSEDHVNSNLD